MPKGRTLPAVGSGEPLAPLPVLRAGFQRDRRSRTARGCSTRKLDRAAIQDNLL